MIITSCYYLRISFYYSSVILVFANSRRASENNDAAVFYGLSLFFVDFLSISSKAKIKGVITKENVNLLDKRRKKKVDESSSASLDLIFCFYIILFFFGY